MPHATYTVYPRIEMTRDVAIRAPSNTGARMRQVAQLEKAGSGFVDAGLPLFGMKMRREAMARGMAGLNGKGCDSAGATAGQAILGATGTVLAMYGQSQMTSNTEGYQQVAQQAGTDAATAKYGDDPSSAVGYAAAGSILTAASSSWSSLCEARQTDNDGVQDALNQANANLSAATGGGNQSWGGNPLAGQQQQQTSQWISGVDNKVVLAGAAVLLVGGFLYSRK